MTQETQIPRGECGNFIRTTITMSPEMLAELQYLGVRRRLNGKKDYDTSSLVREAVTVLLAENKNPDISAGEMD